MTDLVTAGAKAFATVAHQHGGCCPAGVEICMEIGDCMCAESARAVLAAVEPTIRADERERCAQIADEYSTLWGKAKNDIGLGSAQGGRDIAAAIRDGKESAHD